MGLFHLGGTMSFLEASPSLTGKDKEAFSDVV